MLDIDGVDDRNVIPNEKFRWTNKIVPYVIDPGLSRYIVLIQQSIQDYHTKTCLRFQPRILESNYIRIFAGDGCYSNVGMIGGQQTVSLGRGCMFLGTIVHELGHAIGFYHEHSRSDRDQFLTIYWENIQRGSAGQFFLLKPNQNLLLDDFDTNSIMLYGETAFSKDGFSKTMVAKSGVKLLETYDKPGLSASDVKRIKQMYKC